MYVFNLKILISKSLSRTNLFNFDTFWNCNNLNSSDSFKQMEIR